MGVFVRWWGGRLVPAREGQRGAFEIATGAGGGDFSTALRVERTDLVIPPDARHDPLVLGSCPLEAGGLYDFVAFASWTPNDPVENGFFNLAFPFGSTVAAHTGGISFSDPFDGLDDLSVFVSAQDGATNMGGSAPTLVLEDGVLTVGAFSYDNTDTELGGSVPITLDRLLIVVRRVG